MNIQGLKKYIDQVKDLPKQIEPSNKGVNKGESFTGFLKDAMKEVEDMQQVAETHIEKLVTGQPGTTVHEAMIALEKADMSFQLMNTIRTKIIRAYEEVMRTQV